MSIWLTVDLCDNLIGIFFYCCMLYSSIYPLTLVKKSILYGADKHIAFSIRAFFSRIQIHLLLFYLIRFVRDHATHIIKFTHQELSEFSVQAHFMRYYLNTTASEGSRDYFVSIDVN